MFEYQTLPRVLLMPMQVQWGDEPVAAKEPETETTEETPEVEEPEASMEEQEPGEETTEPVALTVNMASAALEEPVAVAAAPPAKKRLSKSTT